MAPFRDYVKKRLDRRYGLTSDIDDLRREVAGELDLFRKELDELKARTSGKPSQPAALARTVPSDHSIRLEVFRSILEPMKPGRLLDLGTGHGKFARIAHELGWEVTAVDARTDRMPMTAGIEWLQSDLREYEIGVFDVIAMLGIFYHLELKDQLEMLKRCAGTMTILDTHVALIAEVIEGGYEGAFYTEVPDTPTETLVHHRDERRPQGGDRARAALHQPLAVVVDQIPGVRVGDATDVGNPPSRESRLGSLLGHGWYAVLRLVRRQRKEGTDAAARGPTTGRQIVPGDLVHLVAAGAQTGSSARQSGRNRGRETRRYAAVFQPLGTQRLEPDQPIGLCHVETSHANGEAASLT